MSSSQPRSGDRVIHQDFIARIRYSNALPPPPMQTKLLDIPNTGLASGQYTTPGFASRLAREQPLNIEVDAELGMPLDLVGMPGIFDGDESSIQAPAQQPQIHPHDRQLLRPLATLGKPKIAENHVSFLRRTEYISNTGARSSRQSSALFSSAKKNPPVKAQKRKSPEPDVGTPAYIKRKIEKDFTDAQKNLKDRSQIRHPQKPHIGKNKGLRIVEAYPLLPDNGSLPDTGAYVSIKYAHAPTLGPQGSFDTRLLSSILMPIDKTEEENAVYEAALEAHEHDPKNNPRPMNGIQYDLYMAKSQKAGEQFRERFDLKNPNRNDDSLYTGRSSDGSPCFPFERVRTYVTKEELELNHETKYSESVFLTFGQDESSASKQKVAWFYPIMAVNKIEPPREQRIHGRITGVSEDQKRQIIDELEIAVEDPPDELQAFMDHFKEKPMVAIDHNEEAGEETQQEASQNGGGVREDSDEPAATNGRHHSEETNEESDAEGDME